jgi:hypothetical protein
LLGGQRQGIETVAFLTGTVLCRTGSVPNQDLAEVFSVAGIHPPSRGIAISSGEPSGDIPAGRTVIYTAYDQGIEAQRCEFYWQCAVGYCTVIFPEESLRKGFALKLPEVFPKEVLPPEIPFFYTIRVHQYQWNIRREKAAESFSRKASGTSAAYNHDFIFKPGREIVIQGIQE